MVDNSPVSPERLPPLGSSGTVNERRCPWCGSLDTVLVQRGYAGPTDEINQYFSCRKCEKVTYEIVSKTAREMRLGRFRTGGIYKDLAHQTRYRVLRILKVGVNEYLLYLKPVTGDSDTAS